MPENAHRLTWDYTAWPISGDSVPLLHSYRMPHHLMLRGILSIIPRMASLA